MSFLSKIFNSKPAQAVAVGAATQFNPGLGFALSSFFKNKQMNLPNGAGSYNSPVPAQGGQYGSATYAPAAPVSLFGESNGADNAFPQAPASTRAPGMTGGGSAPISPRAPALPPSELAYTANAIKNAMTSNGDIPAYVSNAFANPNPDSISAKIDLTNLNNIRNDIAVGAEDPYKWASESGIPYTFAELNAIEKATAGIYDPAIGSALARFENAQKLEEDKRAHDQKMEEMRLENSFKNGGGSSGGGTGNPAVDSWVSLIQSGGATLTNVPAALRNEVVMAMSNATTGAKDPSKQLQVIDSLEDSLQRAYDLSNSAGASDIREWLGNTFVGNPKFNQLNQYINSLRTNMLTLVGDPNIKKFFGPQMSNADVKLMIAASTPIDAKNMTPEQVRDELTRMKDLFGRMKKSIQDNANSATTGGVIPAGTDGTSYGFPGYISDGKQWVLK